MIDKQRIVDLVAKKIEGTEMFLIDVMVSKANKITVLVDGMNGMPIEECIQISRHIEANVDREEEDYELEVSSPGLDKPLKVKQQFAKNIGRKLKVKTNEKELKGELKEVQDEKIILAVVKKEKGKKKAVKTEQIEIPLDEIEETKVMISFK